MKESVLSLKENTTQHLFFYFQITGQYKHSFMTYPLTNTFCEFRYMITRLKNSVQMSIFSTRALFHKYLVAMKYRAKVHL